jgi:hypothetical protein
MTIKQLLSPGTMVVCRPDLDKLILWSSYECDLDDFNATIEVNDVLIILDVRVTPTEEKSKYDEIYTEEWKNGAYLVISSAGVQGWIGEGWVIPVTT